MRKIMCFLLPVLVAGLLYCQDSVEIQEGISFWYV
jgi:hypothetical protein